MIRRLLLLLALLLPTEAFGNERIVSVGGSITEIVYALGLQERLVAVDTTSLYPPQARELPNVGYMRQLAAEPILALAPTLILAVEDSGPPTVLDQLRSTGTKLVNVPDDPSPQGVLDKVALVADTLGVETQGAALRQRLAGAFSRLEAQVAKVTEQPRVLFLLSVGNGAPLAAGRDTSAAGIIALAGGVNAIDGFTKFKPLSPEAAIAAAPDVVLITGRTLGMLGGREGLLTRPELAGTPAAKNGRLVTMDGLLLLGFGPRTPQAIVELAQALHPGMTFDTGE